jgi:hypothetical protein
MPADGPSRRLPEAAPPPPVPQAPLNRPWPRAAGRAVKLVCSCVRAPSALLDAGPVLAPVNPAPRAGDLVLVRCLAGTGAYDHVEDTAGAAVKLYAGDEFVAVLGTRRSGTNLAGEVPAAPVTAGDRLELVAQGGLAARCVSVPPWCARQALPLAVTGFPASATGRVVNLADAPVIAAREDSAPAAGTPLLLVCGTSAESGKTTLACNFNLVLKARYPGLRTAAIKACGTGRARDLLAYRAARYDVVTDFVDAGLPSTYGVPRRRLRAVLLTLIEHCQQRADVVVAEAGGDFLEGGAPEVLATMAELGGECVLLVNDAMGAIEGLRRLGALGREPLLTASFRQNLVTLAARLDLPADRVAAPDDPAALDRAARALLAPHPSPRPP